MASAENVVQILIKAQDQASSVINQTVSNISSGAKRIEEAGTVMQKSFDMKQFGQTVNQVSNQMLALGGSMLGVAGVAAHFGLELNKSISAAGSVAGLAVEQFKEFENVARQMALTSTISAKEIADGMYYIASAGFKGQEVIDAVRGTAALATGTLSDMASTTQLVVSTLSSFGMAAQDSAKVADIFAYSITNSQASVQKLMDSMKYAGPVAKTVGLSLEETTSALSLFYNAGLSGEQAGTALRNILLQLIQPSKDATEALQQFGISLEDIDPRKHSLDEIAKRFAEAKVPIEVIAELVGKEAVSAFSVLVSKGSELRVIEENLKNSSGAAAELNEKVKQTPYGQYELMMNQLREMAYSIFPGLVEAAKTFLEPLTNMVKWFNSLDDGTKKVIAQFTVYGGVLLTTVGTIGKLTSGVISTIESVGRLSQAFSNLSTVANASLAGISSTALQVASVVGLLIYDINQAISLGKALYEYSKIKSETKTITRSANIGENANMLASEIMKIDKQAMDELARGAKSLLSQGFVSTMQEGELLTIALAQNGRLGDLLSRYPSLREQAQKALVTYNVKIDFGNFDVEWRKAGENLKQKIREAIYRGAGL